MNIEKGITKKRDHFINLNFESIILKKDYLKKFIETDYQVSK